MSPGARCTASMIATIAPGAGHQWGAERNDRDVHAVVTDRILALAHQQFEGDQQQQQPAGNLHRRDGDGQVVEDLASEQREHRDHPERNGRSTIARAAALLGVQGIGEPEEHRQQAGRIDDHEQRDGGGQEELRVEELAHRPSLGPRHPRRRIVPHRPHRRVVGASAGRGVRSLRPLGGRGHRLCSGRTPTGRKRESTISLPNGKQVTGIIFRFAIASGMPTMVTAWANAVVTWPMASHRPATRNQTTLPIPEPTPRGRLGDDGAAERPQRVARHPERRDPERDGHDQDAGQDAEEDVAQRQPEAAEDEPDEVQDGAHVTPVVVAHHATVPEACDVPSSTLIRP